MKAKLFLINLNKASNRFDQFEQAQKRKKIMSIIMFFVVLLAIAGATGYRSFQTTLKINKMRADIRLIDEKIAALESSADFLSPEDIFTLAEITINRLVWSEKLSILGNILPKDVAITELVYDDRIDAFLIKGISRVKADMKDLDLVVSIIDIVKSNDDFNSAFKAIKFQSSQRFKRGEQEIVKFEIACLVKI